MKSVVTVRAHCDADKTEIIVNINDGNPVAVLQSGESKEFEVHATHSISVFERLKVKAEES